MHASGGKRRAIIRSSGVVAGSVWDTRIKMDEVEGGVKVFNGDGGGGNVEGLRVYRRLRRNQSDVAAAAAAATAAERTRKRRSWKPPEPALANAACTTKSPPVQLRKSRSELSTPPKISSNGDKSPPAQLRKSRSELSTPPPKTSSNGDEEEDGDDDDDDIEVEVDGSFDDKEIVVPIEKPTNVVAEEIQPSVQIAKELDYVADLKNMEPEIHTLASNEVDEEEEEEETFEFESSNITEAHNRMQNIVDLVMWRDVSKSAFAFGFGSFVLLSSSYAKELNFSLISAISYLGLVYLAMIFVYKSILRRGLVEFDERNEGCMIGEEEAIWALRFLLPYINEVFLKIRALFSGDPSTTMKLALLLFFLARCGGSISTWTLAKLVFFGVFTIPKVFSSYSLQLAKYGKFWLERFEDAWISCTHKKAVAAAVFTLIWNLSSTVARIWAVFMLVVAVKLYKQCVLDEEQWNGEEAAATTTAMEVQVQVEEDCSRQEDSKTTNTFRRQVVVQQQQLLQQHRHRNGPNSSSSSRVIHLDRDAKLKKWTSSLRN